MKRKIHITIFFLIFWIAVIPNGTTEVNSTIIADSCSIFSISHGDTTYFGSNEDFLLDGTYVWFVPRQDYNISGEILNLPGVMLLGFDNNDHIVDGKFQGGMNEYGLCWDSNGLPSVSMYWNTSGKEIWYFNYSIWIWMQPLLECSTVSDVVTWYNTYDLGDVYSGQGHYCDANGDAIVVSVNSTGNLTFTTMGTSHFLVSTNFNVAWPDNHFDPYPCERYTTVTSMLEEVDTEEKLTPEACQDILEAVVTDQTSYSNVFDSVNQEMYLNIYQDFSKTAKINLHDELEKVTPEAEETLFHDSYYYQQVAMSDLMKVIPGYKMIFIIGSLLVGICSITVLLLKTKKIRLY